MEPSELVKSVIAAGLPASTWSLEIGTAPDTPNKVTTLTDTGGLDPNPKYLLDFPTVQVVVRGDPNGYVAARTEARAVKDVCLGVDSQDIGTDRLVAINQLGDVAYIGRDDQMRPMFSINFALIVEPAESANTNRVAL